MQTTDESGALAALTPQEIERNELAALFEAELEAATKQPGWDLATWYIGKLATFDALRDAVRKHYQELMGSINRQEMALSWSKGAAFKLVVDQDIRKQNQGSKKEKKSVTYLTGKAGYRSSVATVKITDPVALTAWCVEHLDTALELRLKGVTPIKEYLKATGEVPPGVETVEAVDKFYPAVEFPELANKSDPAALEGGAS